MPHVIITGGSSGIGLAIAKLYHTRGWRISLLARREDLLDLAAGKLSDALGQNESRVFRASVDVSDEQALRTAISRAEATHGPCNVLVASAGRVDPQDFDAQSPEIFESQFRVNFLGTVYAVRAVLKGMKQRRSGTIVSISSGAALIGIPGYAAYCASKSALAGFVEALREEVSRAGISVCISFPPDTLTPQYESEIALRSDLARAIMGTVAPWPVDKVARKIVFGVDKGKREIHFGVALTLMSFFSPFIKPVLFWRVRRLSVRS